MNLLLADTFTQSLARLTNDEQKLVKTTVVDLQINPNAPGLGFHKLDKARDKDFWSVRVGRDIRLIVHRTAESLLICYVDHHDKAYDWAERRKLETHPKTGAAQLVEVRETVQKIIVPRYVEAVAVPVVPKKRLFAHLADDDLLSYGVPVEWLKDVREADEDSLLVLANHLPAEASEALLEIAVGAQPRTPQPQPATISPFAHPDAQRRFRVMSNVEELERALEYPWDKWSVFLHPEQRQLVERTYSGPARVSGSAGTGKTIVALHRAAYLARSNADARVLLTTFSDTLANALHTKLKRLIGNEPRLGERIDVRSLNAIGQRLYKLHVGSITLADRDQIRSLIEEAARFVPGHKFGTHFILTEWEQVVDAWQLATWDAYRDVARLGRKTRLQEAQRALLWAIFEKVRGGLQDRKLVTHAGMFTALGLALAQSKNPPFDFAVVDEAQDISVAHLRFLSALNPKRADALFFAGDLGQRIFQQPFSWKSLGVDIRGRSSTLRVNYRTSHQIRTQADRLLGTEVVDVDGISEDRTSTVSVFNGPPPQLQSFKSENDEIAAVGAWVTEQAKVGVQPHEFGVFVRSEAQLRRAVAAIKATGLPFTVLDEQVATTSGQVSISTMHLAKGLEFRAVVVMACDDEVIPLQERIETVGDESDLQEVYDTERHLLYVACTRARDHLLITSVEPASEFCADFRNKEPH